MVDQVTRLELMKKEATFLPSSLLDGTTSQEELIDNVISYYRSWYPTYVTEYKEYVAGYRTWEEFDPLYSAYRNIFYWITHYIPLHRLKEERLSPFIPT